MRSIAFRRAVTLALMSTVLPLGACEDVLAPEPLPPSELRGAPTSITLGGKTLVLETYLYRDFMPVSPPNGKPLIAVLRVKTADGSAFPSGVRADGAWVVLGDEVWSAAVGEERFPSASSYEVVARNGPKWGPGVTVDVVVRLREDGEEHRLRASNQPIHRTD